MFLEIAMNLCCPNFKFLVINSNNMDLRLECFGRQLWLSSACNVEFYCHLTWMWWLLLMYIMMYEVDVNVIYKSLCMDIFRQSMRVLWLMRQHACIILAHRLALPLLFLSNYDIFVTLQNAHFIWDFETITMYKNNHASIVLWSLKIVFIMVVSIIQWRRKLIH